MVKQSAQVFGRRGVVNLRIDQEEGFRLKVTGPFFQAEEDLELYLHAPYTANLREADFSLHGGLSRPQLDEIESLLSGLVRGWAR